MFGLKKKCILTLSSVICTTSLLVTITRAELLTVNVPFLGPHGDFVTQQDRYHTFRIPGMVVTNEGTILVFAEGRRGTGEDPRIDENAPADIVMRRSTDLGQSWQPMQVLEPGFRPNGDKVDFGDPTPVLDATTGTIFLFYGRWPDFGPRVSAHGQSIDPKAGNQTLWVTSSDDDGRSWSKPKQLVYPDTPEKTSDGLYWRYVEPGPGNGIQLQWQTDAARNGRLVMPVKRAGSSTPDGEATVQPFVYYSDDHGKTWQLGALPAEPEGSENEVVELTDGRMLMDARQEVGKFRRRFISTDGGATWGPNIPDDIPLTPIDASLVRYSAKRAGHDRDRILFTAPQGDQGLNRNNLTLWTSYDEGKKFINPVQITYGFAAYSVAVRLPDGTIGLLVETDNDPNKHYGAITFYRFDLAEIEADK